MTTPEQLATVRARFWGKVREGLLHERPSFTAGLTALDSLLAALEEMRRERDEARENGEVFRSSMYALESVVIAAKRRAEAAEREVERLRGELQLIAAAPPSGFTRVEHAGDIGMRERSPKDIARAALGSESE